MPCFDFRFHESTTGLVWIWVCVCSLGFLVGLYLSKFGQFSATISGSTASGQPAVSSPPVLFGRQPQFCCGTSVRFSLLSRQGRFSRSRAASLLLPLSPSAAETTYSGCCHVFGPDASAWLFFASLLLCRVFLTYFRVPVIPVEALLPRCADLRVR